MVRPINKLTFAFGATVVLVILIDLATGQGPPVYTQYLAAQPATINYPGVPPPPPPPPPMGLRPVGYVQRGEYDSNKMDKEFEKAIELGKVDKHSGGAHKLKKHGGDKSDKSYEKEDYKGGSNYKNEDDDYESKSTPAPGVLSSFSNSMSGAWNRISHLGRSKRGAEEASPAAAVTATVAANTTGGASPAEATAAAGKSQGRGMDSYELLHQKSNGYIYFKVPKHLVCSY